MNFKERLNNLDPISVYVYVVSALMIGQVTINEVNERSNWLIRKAWFRLLPQSMHNVYLDLLLLLIMFSLINVFITPAVALFVGLSRNTVGVIVVGVVAATLYYLFLREIGDGLI